MSERIADELLFAAPITHDEYAAALKDLVESHARAIRRQKAYAKQDAALAILTEENAKADAALAAAIAKSDAVDALLAAKEESMNLSPAAKPKAKKEK